MFLALGLDKAWQNQPQQGPASGRGLKRCRHARRVRHDWCRGLAVANRAGLACGHAWSSRLPARTSDCSCSNASTASTRNEASPCSSTTASLCEFFASDPSVRTSGSSAISASRHREPERDVVQPQRQGPLGSRALRVARHGFGDPVGRALDRFLHGCGDGGARSNYYASGGSDGDIQAGLVAGMGRSGAGSTDPAKLEGASMAHVMRIRGTLRVDRLGSKSTRLAIRFVGTARVDGDLILTITVEHSTKLLADTFLAGLVQHA